MVVHADARVFHQKGQARVAVGARAGNDGQCHTAMLGELECVTDQVEQNLLQAGGVGQHPGRQVCLHHDRKLQLLFYRQWVHECIHFAQQRGQVHRLGVHRHLAGFQRGDIQNIVQQRQQVVG